LNEKISWNQSQLKYKNVHIESKSKIKSINYIQLKFIDLILNDEIIPESYLFCTYYKLKSNLLFIIEDIKEIFGIELLKFHLVKINKKTTLILLKSKFLNSTLYKVNRIGDYAKDIYENKNLLKLITQQIIISQIFCLNIRQKDLIIDSYYNIYFDIKKLEFINIDTFISDKTLMKWIDNKNEIIQEIIKNIYSYFNDKINPNNFRLVLNNEIQNIIYSHDCRFIEYQKFFIENIINELLN